MKSDYSTSCKILYIAGCSRSGTTYLENAIGQLDGVISIGELRQIFLRSFHLDEKCGCGQHFSKCDFWHDAYEYINLHYNVEELIAYRKYIESPLGYLQRLFPFLSTLKYRERVDIYTGAYLDILKHILEKKEVKLIIDSSKVPLFADLLYTDFAKDVSYVHVTREPHGVVYSMGKKKKRDEYNPMDKDSQKYMRKTGVLLSVMMWSFRNIESLIFSRKFSNKRFISYKSLKDETIVEKLAYFAGLENKNSLVSTTGSVENQNDIKVQHTVSGNPSRFSKAFSKFKYDDEWLLKMKQPTKFIIYLMTLPISLLMQFVTQKDSSKLTNVNE